MGIPKLTLYGFAGLLLMATGFFAGRLSASPTANAQTVSSPPAFSPAQPLNVQFDPSPTPDFGLPQQQTPQAAPDPREMIPLQPGPGQQQPGNPPGQQQGNAQECPVFIYQDGKLYMMPRPGQQPGQGQGNGPGIPGDGSPELIPMQPGPGLPSPGPTNPDPFAPKRPKADSRS